MTNPKNRPVTRVVPAPPGEDDPARRPLALTDDPNTLESDPQDDPDAGLSRVLAELGADASESKVQVFRINRETKVKGFLCSLLPSEFSLERIAEDFGGGLFNVLVYVPVKDENTGSRLGVRLVANKRIVIEGPAKEPKRPDPPSAALAVPASGPSEMALLAGVMKEGFERVFSVITQRPPEKSPLDMLREVAELKKLIVGDAPPARERDPLDQFTKFADVYETMKSAVGAGPAGEGAQLIGVANQFLRMMERANQGQPAQAQLAQAEPLPASADANLGRADPAQAPQQPLPQPIDEGDPVELIYRGYVALLVKNARANSDVNEWAQTIYDQAPDDFLEFILKDAGWFDMLAKFNSDVRLYPAWFEKLRAQIAVLDKAAP